MKNDQPDPQHSNDDQAEIVYSDGQEYQQMENQIPSLQSVEGSILQYNDPQFAFLKKQKIPIQLLYIIFVHFRKDLQELAEAYSCKIKISVNSYMVFCQDAQKQQEYLRCLHQISQFIKTINYQEMKDIGKQIKTSDQKYNQMRKYNHSPYFQALFKIKKIYLTYFNKKLYGFSRQLQKEQIKQQILAISKNQLIFNVRFFNRLNKKIDSIRLQLQVVAYIRKMIQYHKQFFKEREVIVQINDNNTIVYLIGQRPKYLMQSKLQIKSIIQSLVGIVIKNTIIKQNQLIKYLEKTSNYPIHYGKLSQKSYILVSKDNILKQIVKKSNNFFRYTGIQTKLNQQIILSQANIGFHLIRSSTYEKKILYARNKCTPHGYDLIKYNNNLYLKKVFFQDTQRRQLIRKIIEDILISFEEVKDKFQVHNSSRKQQDLNQKKQDQNPLRYVIKGGKQFEQELSAKLRRDVMAQKVQMKKQFMIHFNCNEGKQSVVYWALNKNGEEGEQIQEIALKPGRFIRGRRRISEENVSNCIYQEILTIV